jgi:hypothetical protein
METDKEDIVAGQYEKWVYPEPIKDLRKTELRGGRMLPVFEWSI